ncbi:MAG TPA: hypothetical protein VEH82_05015 [Acidimicrobiales bacterium]|nr:hypothetical protein [Acidimicrobiales bacterium]
MAEGPAAAAWAPMWRGIDELARLVGGYCWLEQRIFEITGSWATGPAGLRADAPEQVVWCAAASRRHGARARSWADRLPLRAGVDRAALVGSPSAALAAAVEALGAVRDGREGITALVTAVLPRLRSAYGAHLASGSPVSEAPVLEVLVRADPELRDEIRDGGHLLAELPAASPAVGEVARELGTAFERSFDSAGVFPAVRAS